ncbi:MAG: hypothetical protein Q9208_007192 [Pyrenodesmia sp. 3 TL-2023]
MNSIKRTRSPQPDTAIAETAHSSPSQPPSTRSVPSPATTVPQTTRAQKRKLDTINGPTHKRLQVEQPPATPTVPPQAISTEPLKTSPQIQGVNPDHDSPTQDVSRNHDSQVPGFTKDHCLHPQGGDQDHGPQIVENIRDRETEDVLLSRPQPSTTAQLSEANLERLQQEVIALEEMDNTVTPSDRGRKRASSRQTSTSELASTRSKEPSHTFYRYSILEQANVYILPEPPPESLQAQIDIIFERKVADGRRREISDMAKEKSRKFSRLLRGAHREDDLVELVHETVSDMHKDETLTHPRKAGKGLEPSDSALKALRTDLTIDWNPELKPSIRQQQLWNFDTLRQDNAAEEVDLPGKRQQADGPFPPPVTSQTTMPPPPAPQSATAVQYQAIPNSAVKTPRPDFTWGFHQSTITDALMKRGLPGPQANRFLAALQRERKLCSDPTQNFLEVRFPILVTEGKAYTTGRTLFEAENQAAVSGSSMLILQRQLETLHDKVVLGLNVERQKSPLAFSLCTQGPIMELWAHHILSEVGITEYHMNLMATCHGSLRGELERFLVQMDRLIDWSKEEYLGEVADQLFAIASHVAR